MLGALAKRRLFGPEIRDGVGVTFRVGDAHRDDDEVRIVRLVVPDRPHHLGRDSDRRPGPRFDHLVAELELKPAADDEVDLLLRLVEVAV